MELFRNRAAAGSFLGSVSGGMIGTTLGGLIAFIAVMVVIPDPPNQGQDLGYAIASIGIFAARVFWIGTSTLIGGMIGAIIGGMMGASRATCRASTPASPTPTAIAPPTTPQDEEIARLKQRIAELERGRDERRES